MTFLEEYIGHKAIQEDIEYFWKHIQEERNGFCPSDMKECNFDGSCRECWNREIRGEQYESKIY